jgi:hypothetical protein
MNKIILTAFALLCAAFLRAQSINDQIETLKKNPNISWISEAFIDCDHLHKLFEGNNFDSPEALVLADGTKLNHRRQETFIVQLNSSQISYWSDFLSAQIAAPNVKKYSDDELKWPLTDKESDTFRQADVLALRLRILIYYDNKTEFFYALPLAMGVKVSEKNQENQIVGSKIIYWIAVKNQIQALKPSNKLAFIKSVEAELLEKDFNLLKTQQNFVGTVAHYFDYVANNTAKLSFFEQAAHREKGEESKKILSPESIKAIRPENIAGLSIQQLIGWDKQKNCFVVSFQAFAPLVHLRTPEGTIIQANTPIFYARRQQRLQSKKNKTAEKTAPKAEDNSPKK